MFGESDIGATAKSIGWTWHTRRAQDRTIGDAKKSIIRTAGTKTGRCRLGSMWKYYECISKRISRWQRNTIDRKHAAKTIIIFIIKTNILFPVFSVYELRRVFFFSDPGWLALRPSPEPWGPVTPLYLMDTTRPTQCTFLCAPGNRDAAFQRQKRCVEDLGFNWTVRVSDSCLDVRRIVQIFSFVPRANVQNCENSKKLQCIEGAVFESTLDNNYLSCIFIYIFLFSRVTIYLSDFQSNV